MRVIRGSQVVRDGVAQQDGSMPTSLARSGCGNYLAAGARQEGSLAAMNNLREPASR
jgi:hypothetical protein